MWKGRRCPNRSKYPAQTLDITSPIPQIEIAAARICIKVTMITLVAIYIPPSHSVVNYVQIFEVLENQIDFSNPSLILGDLNISELTECTYE